MYEDMNNHTETGNYYDTGSSYIHYDSSANLNQSKPKKKKGGFGRTVAKCVALALVFGSVSSAAFMGTNYIGRQYFGKSVTVPEQQREVELNKTDTSAVNTASSGGIQAAADWSGIVENCLPSVVSITNIGTQEFRTFFGTYEQESQSSGSGIIIGQNDTELLIVTNNHVIANAKEISVYFNSDGSDADDDNVVSAKVKGTEPSKDLAVISVALDDISDETLDIIKVATIGDSSSLKIGQPVLAIGNAYGYGLSTTSGIVSALDREVSVQSDGRTVTNKLIQIDAAINPGNSGGALLNSRGELVGINSVKFISEDVEGMGYAIPITDVESIIGNLMNRQTRDKVAESEKGYLGVKGVDVTEEASETYGMPVGVHLNTIVEGGAAEKAGIRKGDIITELDGSAVTGYDQMRDLLSYYSAGETITIKLQRLENSEYVEKTVDVTLSSADAVGAVTNE